MNTMCSIETVPTVKSKHDEKKHKPYKRKIAELFFGLKYNLFVNILVLKKHTRE